MGKTDVDLILCAASGLPPISWFLHCETADQAEHWNWTRRVHQYLYTELKSYFSGQASTLDELPLSPGTKKICYFYIQSCIAFYDLIRHAWAELCDEAEIIELPEFPATPGAYLATTLYEHCKMLFSQCTRYYEFRPRKTYDLHRHEGKVAMLKAEKRELTKKEKKLISKFESEVRKMRNQYKEHWVVHYFCISVCERSNNEIVKDLLARYFAALRKMDHAVSQELHPNRKVRGYTFSKGIKTYL